MAQIILYINSVTLGTPANEQSFIYYAETIQISKPRKLFYSTTPYLNNSQP